MIIRLNNGESDSYKKFEENVKKAQEKAGYGINKLDSTQYSKLFRQELASRLINLALNDIGLVPVTDEMKRKLILHRLRN